MFEQVLMYVAFGAGAFYRLTDRAFHAKAGPDQSVRSVWDHFQRESGWFLARFLVALLIFIGTVHGVELALLQAIVLGLSSGVGFEAAMDRFGSKTGGTTMQTLKGFLVFILLVSLTACPAGIRKDPATGKPYREPTTGEQLLALNVLFAQTNLSVQTGVIKAHELGLLPVGLAGDVVRGTKRVAELDNDLLPLLAAAAEGAPDIPALRAKIAQITAELTKVQVMNGLGIKNPDSQRTFAAEALLLQTLVDQILALVERLQSSPRAWREERPDAIPVADHPGLEPGRHHFGAIPGFGGALEAAARA